MTDRISESNNFDFQLAQRLSNIESSIKVLDTKIPPSSLSDRVLVIEQKFNMEINNLKKEFSEAKREAKFKMIERLTYVTLIVGLITTLVTLKIMGKV